jgi:glycosyltransferase involved in cell wall biosynthesis
MNERERISVVIPSFNAAHFLPAAIESIRQQTSQVDEIIIVDDGSTDDTEQVIHSIGSDIIYIRQANSGVSASRNKGISVATGHLIAFLDADDLWLPQKIERQARVFEDNPRVGLVAADRAEINEQGNLLLASLFKKQGLYRFFLELEGHPIPNVLSRLLHVNFIPTSSVMVRKSTLDKIGGFDTSIRYGEDLELWARIAIEFDIVCLPDVLIHYRRHDENATKATEKLLLDMVRVMKSIRGSGADILRKEGINANKVVAQSLWDLGYWYFTSANPRQAFSPLLESFKESPSLRTLIYSWLSLLPYTAIERARNIKRKMVH